MVRISLVEYDGDSLPMMLVLYWFTLCGEVLVLRVPFSGGTRDSCELSDAD
jgi:hypothetical protein